MNVPLPAILAPAATLGLQAAGQNGKEPPGAGPAAPDRAERPDKPSLPAVSGKASPDGPAIAEWTRSADPGDIAVLTGHNLTALQGGLQETAWPSFRGSPVPPPPIISLAFPPRSRPRSPPKSPEWASTPPPRTFAQGERRRVLSDSRVRPRESRHPAAGGPP